MLVIYTDGSASKNGSKDAEGGYGVIVCETNDIKDIENYIAIDAHSERTKGTTNNREEMKAIIWAYENYGTDDFTCPIVFSDSMYCVNTFTNWIHGWHSNGWVRAGGKQIENLDLVKKYYSLIKSGKKIDLRHVKGHNGNKWNEFADKLATGRITIDDSLHIEQKKYEQFSLFDKTYFDGEKYQNIGESKNG